MKKTTCSSVMVLILSVIGCLLLTPCSAEIIRVACVGDSNTKGYGLSQQEKYPAQLEDILQQYSTEWEVKNFGHNGATVLRTGDSSYRNKSACQKAIAYEPDIVILCFGPNGSRIENRAHIQKSYVSDYMNIIDTFAALPSMPEIWICYPLKAFSEMWTVSDSIITSQIMPLITQIASENNIPLIDFYTAFEDLPHLYQTDGIHIKSSGAKLMAEIVAEKILSPRSLPDFNGDYKVDIEDLVMLIEHWGQNEPSVDIGPTPFGDGVVDAADLEVLMSYWGHDFSLVAHWKLDETGDYVAYDSAADNDAVVVGGALWQPGSGQFNGALQFDGIDDFLIAPFILDPVKQAFSVYAWIKGGQPGQTVISQQGAFGAWLSVGPAGTLATSLTFPLPPVTSNVVITDDLWHRIGLVSDGSGISLYVDDAEVTRSDTSPILPANGGLQIGSDKNLEPGTFFAGMIDDVRIYDRAVTP